MQVKVAKNSGFCFGVRRAVKIAETALKANKKGGICSLGPIIHNPQVVEGLSKKGLSVIGDIKKIKSGTVIISSHGATVEVIEYIRNKKMKPARIKVRGYCGRNTERPKYIHAALGRERIKLIDATCPFVKHAQDIVRGLRKDGYSVIIIGDKKHPEVKALKSIAGIVGADPRVSHKIGIISQTTQNRDNYLKEVARILEGGFKEAKIFNTICGDTSKRQASTRRLLKKCDLMVVIGGRNSANTRRLWQICKESGVDSLHIETESELKRKYFDGRKRVGITSGASTPDSMVKKVAEKIKSFN